MPDKYPFAPRGVIKWQAFSAVISVEDQFKVANPKEQLEFSLLDDYLDDLDKLLLEAYHHNHKVKISYLENNQIKTYESKIMDINTHQNTIHLDKKKLLVESIINIEIL